MITKSSLHMKIIRYCLGNKYFTVLRIRDVYPGFRIKIWIFPFSQISDPQHKFHTQYLSKLKGWRLKPICVHIGPNLIIFFTFSSFHQNLNIFVTKIGFKLSEIIDIVSGENLSRIQGSESLKISDPDHQHWYFHNYF